MRNLFLKILRKSRILAPLCAFLFLNSCLIPPVVMGCVDRELGICNPLDVLSKTSSCYNIRSALTLPTPAQTLRITIDGDPMGLTEWIVTNIRNILTQVAQRIFNGMALNQGYINIITAAMVLSLTIYGAALALGITDTSPFATLLLISKFIAVFVFATQWDTFFTIVAELFETWVETYSSIMVAAVTDMDANAAPDPETGNPAALNTTLNVIDRIVSMFLGFRFTKLILALFFWGITGGGLTGIVFALLFLFMAVTYLLALFDAMKSYIICMIARFILYALAPVFILFALFKQTRSLFDSWLEQIINFSLQPIFMFAFLGIFNLVILGFMQNALLVPGGPTRVCYSTFVDIFGVIPILNWWRIGNGSFTPAGPGSFVPISLWALLAIITLNYLLKMMLNWAGQVAARISGGLAYGFNIPVQGWNAFKQNFLVTPASAALGGVRGALLGSGGKPNFVSGFVKGMQNYDDQKKAGDMPIFGGQKTQARTSIMDSIKDQYHKFGAGMSGGLAGTKEGIKRGYESRTAINRAITMTALMEKEARPYNPADFVGKRHGYRDLYRLGKGSIKDVMRRGSEEVRDFRVGKGTIRETIEKATDEVKGAKEAQKDQSALGQMAREKEKAKITGRIEKLEEKGKKLGIRLWQDFGPTKQNLKDTGLDFVEGTPAFLMFDMVRKGINEWRRLRRGSKETKEVRKNMEKNRSPMGNVFRKQNKLNDKTDDK